MLIGKGFFITYADMLPNEGQYPPGGPGTGHRDAVTFIGFLHFTCPRDAHAQRAGLCVAGVRGQGRGGAGPHNRGSHTHDTQCDGAWNGTMDGWMEGCLLAWLARSRPCVCLAYISVSLRFV